MSFDFNGYDKDLLFVLQEVGNLSEEDAKTAVRIVKGRKNYWSLWSIWDRGTKGEEKYEQQSDIEASKNDDGWDLKEII